MPFPNPPGAERWGAGSKPKCSGWERGSAGQESAAPRWESVGFPPGRAKLNKPRCSGCEQQKKTPKAASPPSRAEPFLTPVSVSVNLAHTRAAEPPAGSWVVTGAPCPAVRGVLGRNGGVSAFSKACRRFSSRERMPAANGLAPLRRPSQAVLEVIHALQVANHS